MKHPKITVQQEDIDYALGVTPWDLGNKVLYDLCSRHPAHRTDEEIIAKVWLIGRSYAAAIERRKNKKDSSDDFYEEIVAPRIRQSKIDEILAKLPQSPADPVQPVSAAITAHKKLMSIFQGLSDMDKRSLASKYLHFHRPDIFFIYDSRAQSAVSKLTPDTRYTHNASISKSQRDEWYYKFCMRVCWLHAEIRSRFSKSLSPRQLDKVLLNVHREND